MKAPVGLLSDRTVYGLRPDKFADVYTSALLATTMKSLNALPKFENHFVVKTVRF